MALELPREGQIRWPEFSHVLFDCDSTLSAVEGIDVIAASLGFQDEVATLTDAAMDGDVELNAVYAERLRMLRPSKQEIAQLRTAYKQSVVPAAREVVAGLLEVGTEVYVVSGGLAEPVRDFAVHLGINPDNVRAVEARHDSLSGEWWKAGQGPVDEEYSGFVEGALTRSDGKAEIISDLLRARTGSSLLVGDGVSDMNAAGSVDLFVGFGGVTVRRAVAAQAPIFIAEPSLAAVLPIALGPGGASRLKDSEALAALERGIAHLTNGSVRFRDADMKARLLGALDMGRTDHG